MSKRLRCILLTSLVLYRYVTILSVLASIVIVIIAKDIKPKYFATTIFYVNLPIKLPTILYQPADQVAAPLGPLDM